MDNYMDLVILSGQVEMNMKVFGKLEIDMVKED